MTANKDLTGPGAPRAFSPFLAPDERKQLDDVIDFVGTPVPGFADDLRALARRYVDDGDSLKLRAICLLVADLFEQGWQVTTKAGMIGMVKAQGKEYATDGITINALAPAVIQTDFLSTQPDSVVAYMLEKIPIGRPGTVDEAAAILAWMTSPVCTWSPLFVTVRSIVYGNFTPASASSFFAIATSRPGAGTPGA